jgi:AcrR family transcriptional regulator
MVRPTRKAQHTDLQQAIQDTAWQQIAQEGAPALSLRAIARALKITAPAIYNYFPSRDELVTALIIDAYTSFGDSQLAARDAVSEADLVGRFRAIGLAYRQWAFTHPSATN